MTEINSKGGLIGDWTLASIWSTDTVPTLGDDVTIAESGSTVFVSSADEARDVTVSGIESNLFETAGSLAVTGTLLVANGLVSLNEPNAIAHLSVTGGVLSFGNSGALGTEEITLSGGQLMATANETLSSALAVSGTSTIAVEAGITLNENSSGYSISPNTILKLAAGAGGTILWHTNGASSVSAPATVSVQVQSGTLKAADANFSELVGGGVQTTVRAGATIDIAGHDANISDLLGDGTVTNSGAAATLALGAANFSGEISGALSVVFEGDATLFGLEDYTGGATLSGTASVTNGGTYDLIADTNINGASSASFINSDVFEKSGGGGVSDVTPNFVNNGTLNVLSGSIEFSGGFTNNGVIHGLVTQSGGVTTISATVPSDFNSDGLSDILWQNASSGQASIWEMNGNARTAGGTVSPNPGPAWKAIGTGDFDGDNHADILWQNSDGQASIWEMNGNTRVGGGAVSVNPGPSWTAVGAGDFNGDGLSDILWQNTSTGQASIWEMSGATRIGGGAVSPNPGPSWKAIGTGDFNGDGLSDILWQNTSTGQASIWEMDETTRIGGGAVSADPGPAWQAIGTGDFNDDGLSDILFQNTGTGQVAIWEMDGAIRIGGGVVSADPGPEWKAVGTGDFNGDGHSEILFQNTSSGQGSIWEMNGDTLISGGAAGANPGPSWRAVGA